jgi:hypothetical protein
MFTNHLGCRLLPHNSRMEEVKTAVDAALLAAVKAVLTPVLQDLHDRIIPIEAGVRKLEESVRVLQESAAEDAGVMLANELGEYCIAAFSTASRKGLGPKRRWDNMSLRHIEAVADLLHLNPMLGCASSYPQRMQGIANAYNNLQHCSTIEDLMQRIARFKEKSEGGYMLLLSAQYSHAAEMLKSSGLHAAHMLARPRLLQLSDLVLTHCKLEVYPGDADWSWRDWHL